MTSPVNVSAALLGTSSAVESAGVATMAGADGVAAPLTCAVVPPSLDPAGVALAAALNARGAATQAMMADLMAARSLFAATIGVNGVSYTASDVISQTLLSL